MRCEARTELFRGSGHWTHVLKFIMWEIAIMCSNYFLKSILRNSLILNPMFHFYFFYLNGNTFITCLISHAHLVTSDSNDIQFCCNFKVRMH